MKGYVLYPPQWIPFSPHLAGPAIQSILCNSDHDILLQDLNIAFYQRVLTTQFMHAAVKSAFADYRDNAETVFNLCPNGKKPAAKGDHPGQSSEILQRRYQRYRAIFKMAQQSGPHPAPLDHNFVIANIEKAAAVMKDKIRFYNPAEVQTALTLIRRACDILSAVYHPSRIYFLTPNVQIYYTVDTLKSNCENREGNIFYQFYESIIPDLLKDDPEFIGVSLGDYSQLVPGLTLTMLLKKAIRESGNRKGPHICIGGNLFGRYTDVLINNPDFFNFFADSAIFNEGEKPVLALIQHLEGKIGIEAVPNLIYVNDRNTVVMNAEEAPFPVDTLHTPDFSNLVPGHYYLPDMIFNIQASRSCYWRKCSFCTHHFGSRYAIKPVEKTIEEIRELQQKHQAYHFHFIDEAISPAYLKKLSECIIEEDLKLNFYMYGRFENAFDRELFRLAYQAGLRMVLWGFETANERIYRLMNKGELTQKNDRLHILQDAYAEGVWNFLFVMFGFPTETLDEAKETVDFLADNRNILSHGTGSTFMLLEDSPIFKELEKYSITKVTRVRNGFSFAHQFETSKGMNPAQKKELEAYKIARWRMGDLQFMESSFRERLFLYICRFGVEKISKMRETMWL
jgi:anaerobic magnesium-protoporphyrin IX monomethyl ester cyclase